MNIRIIVLTAACIAGAHLSAGRVFAQANASQPSPLGQRTTTAESPETRLKDLMIQLDSAKQRLTRAKASYEAGQVTADRYQDIQTEVRRLELAVKDAEDAAARDAQIERLSHPVNIEFKDATLAQAAESLSKASGVPIRVAPSAPASARITLQAKAVPLSTVLESIARHLDLKIEPAGNGGVELQTWPEILIDGQKQVFPEPTGPWSSAWGGARPGTSTGIIGNSGFTSQTGAQNSQNLVTGSLVNKGNRGQTNSAGFNSTVQNRSGNSLTASNTTAQTGFAPAGMLQGVNIAAVGNTLVVAEPGRGPGGEPGAWLTVYLLEGTSLVKKSTLFHPTRATLITPTSMVPQQNGMSTQNGIQSGQNRQSTRGGR